MKKLQSYVLCDVSRALVPAFATLVLIMVVGFCMQLLHEGLDVVRLRSLLPPLFAYCVPMILPAAFLTAVVMTFGRLSADNELVGMRAGGVHLFSIVHPVLVVALLLTGVTAAFQFELVPRSRAAIERMKYRALRQILLDKVVLSTRRQLSFEPVFIQYEDFSEGKLTDLLLIRTRDHRPEDVITASTAVIHADPERPDTISFEMEDCVRTSLGPRSYTKAGPTRAKRVIYSFGASDELDEIATDEKHLPTGRLLARLEELKQRVAGQEKFDRPERVHDRLRKEIRLKKAEISEVETNLRSLQEDYQKYGVRKKEESKATIRRSRERIQQAREQLEVLRSQLLECVEQINELGNAEDAERDLERLLNLEKQAKALRAEVENRKKDIQEHTRKIEQATRDLEDSLRRARRIKGRIEVLRRRKEKLVVERDELQRRDSWARDQKDLTSVRLRIHKRLAQAFSLFAFALIGIPLGIMAGGRSTMIAFGISFAIVLVVFYPFLILGQITAKAGVLPVAPAMWAGNFLVFLIGLALTIKVLLR